ncbi:MAG: AAA family ATPase [Deltaproteobacteria bacterium]|nr:AAA family ATPase [Deltaproteobacteria bacterium]
MPLKNLPLGDQTFAELIDSNCLYADKTRYIYDLLKSSKKNYFLSRPRRFGKTLLLHTLNELFTGNRDRFKGLWIDGSDYEFTRHPTLFLSLSMASKTSEILNETLLSSLGAIAREAGVDVQGVTPDMYFGNLIRALHKQFNSKVAVLIDEYDFPVTVNMENSEIAEDNAKVLHQFFSALKRVDVSPCVRFTLVTGITRYALTSMDSGPNHLNDISLNPRYAGICGFTLEEFDILFSEGLEEIFDNFKGAGELGKISDISDLKAEILHWYDGYNWEGPTRVLNPYSILNFFENKRFDAFWVNSGRPAHLRALIRKKTLDFITPKLESYLSQTVRKAELTQLAAVPVLFHSGYLTVDKVTPAQTIDPVTQKTVGARTYSFKLPNHEVGSTYYKDCFQEIFQKTDYNEFKSIHQEIITAILAGDARALSDLFSQIFSSIAYHQKPEGEKNFHAFIQLILLAADFTLLSELPGSKGRLDLVVELPKHVYAVMELKYCKNQKKRDPVKENSALAALAAWSFPLEEAYANLASMAVKKLKPRKIALLLTEKTNGGMSEAEKNKILALEAIKNLSEVDFDEAMAKTVREKLTPEELKRALSSIEPIKDLSPSEIHIILAKAARKALSDITKKLYHDQINLKAKKIIDIGISIYGNGNHVMALFGHE